MAEGTAQSAPAKRAAHRSPNYPAFGLGSALEKVRKVYDKDKRNPTTPLVIAGHLGYKQVDGPGGRAVSCLRQYGLLEESAGMLRVSDLAFNLLHLPAEDPERAVLMRQAALKPNLYRQLHEDYPNGIPSDSTLTSNLLKREFNPGSIADLIADFRDTMAVAKVYDVSENGDEDESKMDSQTNQAVTSKMPPKITPQPGTGPIKQWLLTFEGDGNAVLTITAPYTAEDLDDLESTLTTGLKALRRSLKKESQA